MKLSVLRKYISANLLACAGYIFARDWYILFDQYVNIKYTHESFEDIAVLMAIFFTFFVAIVVILVLGLVYFIECKIRKISIDEQKLILLKKIHLVFIILGLVLFAAPIILIIGVILVFIVISFLS